jgi:hypothetical protein
VEVVLEEPEPDTDAVPAGRLFRCRRCPFRFSAAGGVETRLPLGVAAPFRLLPRAPKHRGEVEWLRCRGAASNDEGEEQADDAWPPALDECWCSWSAVADALSAMQESNHAKVRWKICIARARVRRSWGRRRSRRGLSLWTRWHGPMYTHGNRLQRHTARGHYGCTRASSRKCHAIRPSPKSVANFLCDLLLLPYLVLHLLRFFLQNYLN